MDNQQRTFSPCSKCGGDRIDTDGTTVGLEYARSVPVVCLSCGFIEFYAKPETLEKIKKDGSYAAQEARMRRAEQERDEAAKSLPKKRSSFSSAFSRKRT